MIQSKLTTTTINKNTKVPIFIFNDKYEATELARLILKVKPNYLLNLSNSIESLRNHIKTNVNNNICYIMDLKKAIEIKNDYELVKKVKFIDFFRFQKVDYEANNYDN